MLFVQNDSGLSSKQLALSADNLLSLQMDAYLTLSSSALTGRSAESLPVSRSPDVHIADCKRIRRRGRLRVRPVSCQSRSTKPTAVVPDVDSQSYVAATGHNCSLDLLHNEDGRLSDSVPLHSDSVDVDDVICSVYASQQGSELPRSGSHITRKKAFYKIERPLSIVRRDSSPSTTDDCPSTRTS